MISWGLISPWTDRDGRVSALKGMAFIALAAPAGVMAWQWFSNDLGASPITAAMDDTGLWSIRCLLLAFAATPVRRLLAWRGVVKLRRMLGVASMCYGLAHFCFYVEDQGVQFDTVVHELTQRTYLIIGGLALVGLIVLGLTSTDGWMRRLGKNWRRLHQAIYPIVILASVHFFMWSKIVSFEAVFVSGMFIWLIVWRLLPRTMQRRPSTLMALAPATALATAVAESGWYGLATSISPGRVFLSNFDVGHDIRPAVWVGIAALVIAGLAGLREPIPPVIAHSRS